MVGIMFQQSKEASNNRQMLTGNKLDQNRRDGRWRQHV